MTERDKIRICKALAKRLANIDLKSSDIQIKTFDCYLVVSREGFKQQKLLDVTFNNGVISFDYCRIAHKGWFHIYPNLNLVNGCGINCDTLYFDVKEYTQYINGNSIYKTSLMCTVHTDTEEPHTEIIF